MRRPLILWGASGQAKVLLDFLQPFGYEPVAVFDNNREAAPPREGIPIYCGEAGFREWHASYTGTTPQAVIAIGSPGQVRLEMQRFLARYNIDFVQAVHPSAVVARTAKLGRGCQILAHGVVAAETTLGDQCIVNTSASVDHECVVGNGVHVAPGARVLGCVEVGEFTFIGAGSVVLSRLKIGSNSIVGAGAVVVKDVPDDVVVYGNPAEFKRAVSSAARP